MGFGYRLLNSDGDLARHLRLGEIMLDQHGLLRTDVFSFTKAGQPFLAFEYGSELLYAGAYRLAGLAGVAVLAGLVLALTYALVARFLIRRGGDPLLAYLVSMAAAVLSAAHWLARPHLFTLLLVVVLLELLHYTGRRALLLYALLFVVWANLHGGFSFGCILIGLYAAGEAIEGRLSDRSRPLVRPRAPPRRGTGRGAGRQPAQPERLQAAGARLRLLRQQRDPAADPGVHVARLPHHQRQDLPAGAARGHRRARAGAGGARRSRAAGPAGHHRLLPDLAAEHRAVRAHGPAAPGPAPGPGVAGAAVPARRQGGVPAGARRAARRRGRRRPWRCCSPAWPWPEGTVAGVAVIPNRFDDKAFPVRATAEARRAGLEGRMFSHFIWGGYLMHEWPEQRVFIDGGTDHYGEKLFNEYIQVWNLDPGWRDVHEAVGHRPRAAAADSRLADELERDQGWRVWHCDSTAVLLQRPGGAVERSSRRPSAGACPAMRPLAGALIGRFGDRSERRRRRRSSRYAPTASEQIQSRHSRRSPVRGQAAAALPDLRPSTTSYRPGSGPRRLSGLVRGRGPDVEQVLAHLLGQPVLAERLGDPRVPAEVGEVVHPAERIPLVSRACRSTMSTSGR